ncbi:uncharacterized protein [Gossypium hirsutum]|uniref:Reverse transcriptase/retrotransposon-derived protein RNase H-like domain-containing protein n=1 Tax=Gossypium hirsutum TaxID=3635 RepID=A0A1U8P8K0_GOSHI|nr:uncharacterized protein LOC107956263 [Gossypium hirsutum]
MGDVKETLELIEGRIDEPDSMEEQLKEYVEEVLSSNMDALQALLNIAMGKLIEKDEALKVGMIAMTKENETTMKALNTKIKELEGELVQSCCYIVGGGRIRMDGGKIWATIDWKPPTKGLQCQKAFDQVKQVITNELMLALLDYSKLYEVCTDASDYVTKGVLIHRHLIAFESQKLNDTEQRFTVQEKKMTAVVFMAKLDFIMEYKPGKANAVVDALSRKVEFAAISQPDSALLDHIREGLSHDPITKTLIELAK